MQKSNDDCFYFLTSTCAKVSQSIAVFFPVNISSFQGSTCSYRHNPTVLTCNVICPAWSRGNCIDPTCPFRHSTTQVNIYEHGEHQNYVIHVQRPAISNGMKCFYENTPMGCLKLDCTFVHLRSRSNLRNSPTLRRKKNLKLII